MPSRERVQELAYQRWEGDRIVEERFYYDPSQREQGPPNPSSAPASAAP